MEKETTYAIEIEVRDEKGKILRSPDNGVKQPRMQFDLSVKDEKHLEFKMKDACRSLRAWLPEGYSINATASIHSHISNTYMVMYSYYEGVERFIKH